MLENFGRYQLLKKLATGGMGQVFLARQKGPVGFEKLVVVKRILPHLAEEDEFIQMFFDEARIAAHLNHPNIAQIYDLGEAEGIYYIAMEYVHGEAVRAVNARANADRGGVPVALKCRILADAAAGLDFAHRAKSVSGEPLGLIHRDVSPQNILVGFNGSVKLIDFGVAKARGKVSNTLTGAIKGKYAYMSPEQARGEALDSRSDVFGLGIVFYELLTSARLFKRETETETLKAVAAAKIAPPSTLVKGIPKPLDAIVLKALARKRKDRYQTAGEFLLDLEDFLIRQRLPSTNAHLAAFMQDLFADQLAAEKVAADKDKDKASGSPNAGTAGDTPPLQGTQADLKNTRGSRSGSASAPPKAVVVVDLESRLKATDPDDRTQGVFFNSILQTVTGKVGAQAEPKVRAAANTRAREYRDQSSYDSADFLRMLWRAAEDLSAQAQNTHQAFYQLGVGCMESLLQVTESTVLQQALSRRDIPAFLAALMSALDRGLQPGDRHVSELKGHTASVVYEHDLLPPSFHAGFLTQALTVLAGKAPKVDFARKAERMLYRVSW